MFSSSWGTTAQAIINGIGGGTFAAIIVLALVITAMAALFDWHPQAHKAFWSILFIGILIAGAAWVVNMIPGI